jgi:chromosome segregation ATPase
MIRRILLLVLTFWIAACSAHDERYYSLHPNALQEALKNCNQKSKNGLTCAELKEVAVRMNELAYQLRDDPQGYGKQILALQEKIANQESDLEKNLNQPELKTAIANNKNQLRERLAVVKWLESPES